MTQPGSKISVGLSYREQPNKAYQSTRAFNSGSGALFLYSTSVNSSFQTVGSLVINPASSAANCPAGRVVHANGKVLNPAVHVGGGAGVNPATGTGTTTPNPLPFPLVGVYDPVSGLNGYINPQDSTWAAYDATLGAFYDNAGAPSTALGGQGAEPRFGAVLSSAGAANETTNASPAVISLGAARTGSIIVKNNAATQISVTASEATANSIILLTYQGSSGTVIPRVGTAPNASGAFTIDSPAAFLLNQVVNYVIIN